MDIAGLIVLFVLGAGLGVLGGLLGIGGGLFAIPLLVVAFGLDQQHAQGTSLVMVLPNVIVGLYGYAKRGMDLKLSLALGLPALPLTVAGAHLATRVPSAGLRVAFGCFTLLVGAYALWRMLRLRSDANSAPRIGRWPIALAVGALGGAVSGAFGVGGAIVAVPLLSAIFGFGQAAAQGYGLALVAPGTFAGIAAYAAAGDVDWPRGLALAAGGVFAVPYGVKLAHRLPERFLRGAFVALTLTSGVVLLLRR